MGLFSTQSMHLVGPIAPAVLLGLPLGSFLIRYMRTETFRRICMSFDAWIVGFGLSRTIIDLKMLTPTGAYGVWSAVMLFDLYLLFGFLITGRFRRRVQSVPAFSSE